jgi:O-antigen ligase
MSLLLGILLPLSLAVPTSPLRRLLTPNYSDDEAVEARAVAWKAGINMIASHPIFGVGLGNFKPLSASYEDPRKIIISVAHNTYIEMAAELGVPGLAIFLSVQVGSFLTLARCRRSAERIGHRFLENASLGLQSGLIGTGLALFFVSGQVQKLFWFNIFLGMCIPSILKRAQRSRRTHAQSRQPQPG